MTSSPTIDRISCPPFTEHVDEANRWSNDLLETLQINIGLKCNLSCRHCHVQAGPDRTELMSRDVMKACLRLIDSYRFSVLDITGGAPEMNPDFEWLLKEAAARRITVMVRSNLVILNLPDYKHLAELYAQLGIQLVVSLPHYIQKNSDAQRGAGSFDVSIEVLKRLNALGYGMQDTNVGANPGLILNLVYNPGGAFIPSSQEQLEREYKQRLHDQFGIGFNNLFAITNNPLGRFASALSDKGTLQGYMDKLVAAFNPATLPSMMCRSQLSIDYRGVCYDCDFNQAADMPCLDARTVFDYCNATLGQARMINFGNHCYACCAGSGSSCGGTTA